jgi:hypothetical protein
MRQKDYKGSIGRHRRRGIGAGMAVGALLAAATIPVATAGADPDHDPFVDLFGNTPMFVDLDAALQPSIANSLDMSVDNLLQDADPFADLFGPTLGAPIDAAMPTWLDAWFDLQFGAFGI